MVASAALAKLVYIALLLNSEQETQPHLAGGMLLHYIARPLGITQLRAAVALAFLIVIAIVHLLKVSATLSRGGLLIAPDGSGDCHSSRRS